MLCIGTAGYSYDDWIGPVYPPGSKKGEMLEHYTREFTFSEINSTYYAIPNKYVMFNLDKKTPAGFEFVVKAHQSMTHKRDATAEIYSKFLEALHPLRESGKLGAVLAQFPYSFHFSRQNMEYLARFRAALEDIPVCIEFRNQQWMNDKTFAYLKQEQLGFVCVDEPNIRGLVKPVVTATTDIGYVRLHGRNAAQWYDHKEAYERYNYLYTEDELKEWVPRIRQLAADVTRLYVSFNNHYQGQAVKNARQMRDLIGK